MMPRLTILMLLATLWMVACTLPAHAATIPNVRGLRPFTAQTYFMSLPGYLRGEYFTEHDVWISPREARILVAEQISPTVIASGRVPRHHSR